MLSLEVTQIIGSQSVEALRYYRLPFVVVLHAHYITTNAGQLPTQNVLLKIERSG
jgi:hypothetical protein